MKLWKTLPELFLVIDYVSYKLKGHFMFSGDFDNGLTLKIEYLYVEDRGADLKISLYVCIHVKTIPWKFRILNPKNSRVIYPWSL